MKFTKRKKNLNLTYALLLCIKLSFYSKWLIAHLQKLLTKNFPVNKKNSAVISPTDLSHPESTDPRALRFNLEGTFCASV